MLGTQCDASTTTERATSDNSNSNPSSDPNETAAKIEELTELKTRSLFGTAEERRTPGRLVSNIPNFHQPVPARGTNVGSMQCNRQEDGGRRESTPEAEWSEGAAESTNISVLSALLLQY